MLFKFFQCTNITDHVRRCTKIADSRTSGIFKPWRRHICKMEGKAARRKRGYYQVYLADKSVPKPKVSLWRFEKKTETAQPTKDYDDCHFHDSTASPSLDHVDPADFIDAFHKETFDDVSDFLLFNCCKTIQLYKYIAYNYINNIRQKFLLIAIVIGVCWVTIFETLSSTDDSC